MFSGELMFIKLFKWMQALIFGYLFFERVVLVLPDFRIVDLLLASVAFLLLAGYAAYLISDRLIFFSFFSDFIFFIFVNCRLEYIFVSIGDSSRIFICIYNLCHFRSSIVISGFHEN